MFEIRTDNKLTAATQTDEVARLNECRELHNWPEIQDSVSGDRVTVAVMDSGIDSETANNHWWFDDTNVTKRFDVTGSGKGKDNIGHGTGVASIIAHNTPPIDIWSVKIFGKSGSTGFRQIRRAYEWMIERGDEIDVVNMSWGASQDVPQINKLHERLLNKGVNDVVAAGNTGTDGGSPATSERAFSAGAINEDGEPVRFSSFDPDQGNPDIAAIGQNVVMARARGTAMGVPLENDKYVKASGTSFSAPYVSAAYALSLYNRRQNWDNQFVATADDVPGTKKDGAGILKLGASLESNEKQSVVKASSWNFNGNDTVWLDADWVPENVSEAEKLGETKDYIDIRIKKK